jgi:hypothetical protein|tara:strand:- start:272 stop:754 length:483 start_codon:yes stop_codon:yes gene_type:complete
MVTKTNKLPLKDILAAIDMNAKNVWDELSDDERKQVSFYLLNRYVSAIKGKTEDKQLQIFKTNQYYNKNFFTLSSKHKKLLWYLLCMTANTSKSIRYHEWIGYKQKVSNSTAKAIKFLEKLYPTKKQDELKLLATINTTKELKQLAEDMGMPKEQIKKIF